MSKTYRLPACLAFALSALLGAVLVLTPAHATSTVKLPTAGPAADPSPTTADQHQCC